MTTLTAKERLTAKQWTFHNLWRPQHAVTYPRMSEQQKAAQIESRENLENAIRMQLIRKAKK